MDRRDWLKWAFCSAWAELAGVRSSMAQSRRREKHEKVVVVGAGIAGLAAARELSSLGFQVLVLEGRGRTGGRIWTDRSLSTPVELGAGSIEIQRRNPLTPLARKWQIAAEPLRYDSVRLYDVAGTPWGEGAIEKIADRLEAAVDRARRRAKAARPSPSATNSRPDQAAPRSVQDAVAARGLAGSLDTALGRAQHWAAAVQTCEYGAELRDLSLAWFDDDFEADWDDLLVVGGFDRLIERLAAGLDIRLGHEVQRIAHDEQGVQIETSLGAFAADRAIVTLPLGVLKAGQVEFSPALPRDKLAAIHRLEMGLLNKVALQYAERFWPADSDFLGFSSRTPGMFPQFLNLFAATGRPVLVAAVAGDYARALEPLSDEQIVARAQYALRSMFASKTVPEPTAFRVTRWASDRWARGSYSYVPVAASGQDYDTLAEPVDERLFFAGEATNREFPATAHGAYLSGLREAARLAGRSPAATYDSRR
ncbi:MAG TPA: FAD-dependent oxidoreductase [Pirellulales bacterium]|nr:FAD-dependent oxidoreductase [Pirellulales bacterium]